MDRYNEEVLNSVLKLEPVTWYNSRLKSAKVGLKNIGIDFEEILEAERRLRRFAPLIKKLFPETENGIIESPLEEIEIMKNELERVYGSKIKGRLFIKCDSHLKIAGSVKARGGIYEVLKYAETLALEKGLIKPGEDYSVLGDVENRKFFSNYSIAVGSTGNLGLSIGIISSALGFKVTVHMSKDAKEWKKTLLRARGVKVIEYDDDYCKAVEEGRKQCAEDPKAYFIDDENSKDLFLGYAVAALRLEKQLESNGIKITDKNPLYLYLPCGVGGAPGGITFGAKILFGDHVHCYFAEPTHSPCMLLGLLSEKYNEMHVRDFNIDNITEADGLAVGSPSKLVSRVCRDIMDGEYTIDDKELFKLLSLLKDSENIKIEVSAAAGFLGPSKIKCEEGSIHVVWATGGLFLPEKLYKESYEKGKLLLG